MYGPRVLPLGSYLLFGAICCLQGLLILSLLRIHCRLKLCKRDWRLSTQNPPPRSTNTACRFAFFLFLYSESVHNLIVQLSLLTIFYFSKLFFLLFYIFIFFPQFSYFLYFDSFLLLYTRPETCRCLFPKKHFFCMVRRLISHTLQFSVMVESNAVCFTTDEVELAANTALLLYV